MAFLKEITEHPDMFLIDLGRLLKILGPFTAILLNRMVCMRQDAALLTFGTTQ